MTASDPSQRLFHIDALLRSQGNYQDILDLDAIVLQRDKSDAEKMALIQQLIQHSIDNLQIQEGGHDQ